MIDKCANPECEEHLVYLRSGVLYAVDVYRESEDERTTHFFWMCESCSSRYRLRFDRFGEPHVVPVNLPAAPYDSEASSRNVHSIRINPPPRSSSETPVTAGSQSRPASLRLARWNAHAKDVLWTNPDARLNRLSVSGK